LVGQSVNNVMFYHITV